MNFEKLLPLSSLLLKRFRSRKSGHRSTGPAALPNLEYEKWRTSLINAIFANDQAGIRNLISWGPDGSDDGRWFGALRHETNGQISTIIVRPDGSRLSENDLIPAHQKIDMLNIMGSAGLQVRSP